MSSPKRNSANLQGGGLEVQTHLITDAFGAGGGHSGLESQASGLNEWI
jgi:hypothetical protein